MMTSSYFELFELPVSFDIDLAELNRKYISLQKRYHPDFHAGAASDDLDEVMQRSSMLNEALQVLRNPDARMRHVLQLHGQLDDEEKYALPPDFLMAMMELNEEEDATIREEGIRRMQESLETSIAPVLSSFRPETAASFPFAQVKDYYFRKKYLRRILDKPLG